jgi:hypothetical protein
MDFNIWWVSQNQSYKYESVGGYIWSPKLNRNGTYSHYYNNMTLIRPGDLVFSYASSRLVSLGIAKSSAYSSSIPKDHVTDDSWAEEGWRVDIEYYDLDNKISPTEHFETIKPYLPEKYGPLNRQGTGNQAYLFLIPRTLGELLISLIGEQAISLFDSFKDFDREQLETLIDDSMSKQGDSSNQSTKTTIIAIVEARKGQGKFKANVAKIESGCRLTNVNCTQHLIASHIKPWKNSSNVERLDGNNGLLLSPHIDHLFDRGHISFEDTGELIIGESLSDDLLTAWNINSGNYGSFNDKQKQYLEFHRAAIFNNKQKQTI